MQNKSLSYKDLIQISLESSPNQTIHWHDSLEIILVVEGNASLHVSFEKIELEKNHLMVINSAEPHRIFNSSKQSELICINLDIDYCYSIYSNLYEALAVSDFDVTFKNLNENRVLLFSNILSIIDFLSKIDETDENNDEVVFSMIDTLLNNIISSYKPKLSNEYLTKKVPKEKIEMIHRLIRYLYDNYDQDVNLQTFSDQEFFNFYYVSHNIKEITGTSFRDWLNYVRVEQSEKLLLNTDKSITTISEECGFSDVRYYNKHFYKWHKVTPLNFRRLFKQPKNESKGSPNEMHEALNNPDFGLVKHLATIGKETGDLKPIHTIHFNFNDDGQVHNTNLKALETNRLSVSIELMDTPHLWDRALSVARDMGATEFLIDIEAKQDDASSLGMEKIDQWINFFGAHGIEIHRCRHKNGDMLRDFIEAPLAISNMMISTGLKSTRVHLQAIMVNLDKRVIAEGDDYILCGRKDRFTVIVFNNGASGMQERKYRLRLLGVEGCYKVASYQYGFCSSTGSGNAVEQNIFDKLDAHEIDIINWMNYPRTSFDILVNPHQHERIFKLEANEGLIWDYIRLSD